MSQDYHYRKIAKLDKKTGYPMDEYGHHLDPNDKRGDEARELTSPYGSLEYAIGSGDDFHCFDFAILEKGKKKWVALHSVINSETGSFIMDGSYEVVTPEEAPNVALGMIDQAMEWVHDNRMRGHSEKGWNQDTYYFYRAVWFTVHPEVDRTKFSYREFRHGGKKIAAVCGF